MQVLGNRDLLSLICKQILAIENFEDDIPLRALSALSRVCRRTHELLCLHPDLVCARRVKETAFICEHQTRTKDDHCCGDMCEDNPYNCENSNRTVYKLGPNGPERVLFCVCKCHSHACLWCVGPLQRCDWAGKKNLQSWRVTQKECADFQRYQYAYAIEGNFAVASFYLSRCAAYAQDFPTRVCRAEYLLYALSLGHVDLYRACVAQDEFYCAKDFLNTHYIEAALFSGDPCILRDTLRAATDDESVILALYSFFSKSLKTAKSIPKNWNIEKSRADRRGRVEAWNTNLWLDPLHERTKWESRRRSQLLKLHAPTQLRVMNEFMQSRPSLREELFTKSPGFFAELAIAAGFDRHFVKDILLDLCVVEYKWFDAAAISRYLKNVMDSSCAPSKMALFKECFKIATATASASMTTTNKRARVEK